MTGSLPYSNQTYGDTTLINDITGLDWGDVNDTELIRKKDADTAEGSGIKSEDAGTGFDSQKTISFFERVLPLKILLGAIRFAYTLVTQTYQVHIAPRSSLMGTEYGIFANSTLTDDRVKVGINTSTPSNDLVVGTTLFVDDTSANKRVGINTSTPTVDFEVGDTLYVDDVQDRVGINSSTPSVTFEVGNTLYVNNSTRRIGIGIDTPEEELEVDGSIQIDSSQTSRLKFQKSGQSPHQEAEIDGTTDGTNGGILEFFTKVDGGSVTEKLRINNAGAIGLGGATYGDSGQVLTSGGSSGIPTWTTPTPVAYAQLTTATSSGVAGEITLSHATTTNIRFTSIGVTSVGGISTDTTTSPFPITFSNAGVYKISGYITNLGVSGSRSLSLDGRIKTNEATPQTIILFGYFEASGEEEVIAPVPFDCIHQTTTANESIFITLNARASNSVSTKVRQYDSRVNIVRIA